MGGSDRPNSQEQPHTPGRAPLRSCTYPRTMSGSMSHLLWSDFSRRGPAAADAFSGAAGGTACGDLARISLAVEDGIATATSFDAEGCAATAAGCAAAAELAE